MPVRILESDGYYDMAIKIYRDFEVGQSCTISGFVIVGNEAEPKGEVVIRELEKMDIKDNVHIPKDGRKRRRKRVKPPNSIGDYVAQKMWVWEKVIRDGKIKFIIWRKQ